MKGGVGPWSWFLGWCFASYSSCSALEVWAVISSGLEHGSLSLLRGKEPSRNEASPGGAHCSVLGSRAPGVAELCVVRKPHTGLPPWVTLAVTGTSISETWAALFSFSAHPRRPEHTPDFMDLLVRKGQITVRITISNHLDLNDFIPLVSGKSAIRCVIEWIITFWGI